MTLENLDLSSNRLLKFKVPSLNTLKRLNLANNQLGVKSGKGDTQRDVVLGDKKVGYRTYTTHKDFGWEEWDWNNYLERDMREPWPTGMEYFNMSGNNIYFTYVKGDACNGRIGIWFIPGSQDDGSKTIIKYNRSQEDWGRIYYNKGSGDVCTGPEITLKTIFPDAANNAGPVNYQSLYGLMDTDSHGIKSEPERRLTIYPWG